MQDCSNHVQYTIASRDHSIVTLYHQRAGQCEFALREDCTSFAVCLRAGRAGSPSLAGGGLR
jgi:hypothetical protein